MSPHDKFTDHTTNQLISVPIGISARHIHLCQEDMEKLFGPGHQLTPLNNLYQPGHFAAKEVVSVVGPKGVLEEVRILGPVRKETQVEISRTDAYQLGIEAPIRDSGDLTGTPGAVLVGPNGPIMISNGVIMAASHIHMGTEEAARYGYVNSNRVELLARGQREISYRNVKIRVDPNAKLEFHLDTDEANAALVKNGDFAVIKSKNTVIFDKTGQPVTLNQSTNITFHQVAVPHSTLGSEALALLRYHFTLDNEEFRKLVKHLLMPGVLFPNKFYLLSILKDDKTAGAAAFYYLSDVKFGYVEYILIKPDFQKLGLGSHLYHKIISILEDDYPDLTGMVLEVRSTEKDLAYRKEFFLNLGAIPIDISFYPVSKNIADSGLMFMFQPLREDANLNWPTLAKTLDNLAEVMLNTM
ncbi:MAG: phosphate propanoyltransferase [Clostridia bacterium]|nr:phosphate propanoyltransferase [Clostridia bacterium]